jgi:tetratricopeptide (TPR) repeat protein
LTYWLWGQKEQALTQWQSDPQAVIYLMGQGQQAFVAEEWQIAISWYTAALELNSANGRIHYERAQAYEAANLHAQALAEYQQAITLLPGDNLAQQAKAWEGIGRTSVQLANWQQAAVAFSQAVTLMPNVADYQQQLHDVNQMLQEMKAQQ